MSPSFCAPRPCRLLLPSLVAVTLVGARALAQAQNAETLPLVEVTSARDPAASPNFPSVSLDQETLRSSPGQTVDELIKGTVPAFSLFRRSGSTTAHPTTQGPALRNIAPNGAGRALILLDGVPQNDPFGGWVYWQRLPASLLDRVTVAPGGGAGLFGNNALGGTLYLTRREVATLAADTTLGTDGTHEATLQTAHHSGPWTFTTALHERATDGHHVIPADQRGPVDRRADSRARLAEGSATLMSQSGARTVLRGSWFEEDRGNGTPYTGSHSQAAEVSLHFSSAPADTTWEALLYYQHRDLRSTFSSVDEDRTAETPALDQYEVPVESVGFSLTSTMAGGMPLPGALRDSSRLVVGLDGRWTEGATHERYRYMEGQFLNQRKAGGTQWLAGAFAEQTWAFAEGWDVTLGGRADYWRLASAMRRETTLATGAVLREESLPDRDGFLANARVGLAWTLDDALTLRTAAYTGFRVPTLNELHRPFRVRDDITAANPGLDPERLTGMEAGWVWQHGPTASLSTTAFWNELADGVANVTVLEGPGTAPDGTVVPAGGTYRERRNVPSIISAGLEVQGRWEAQRWLTLQSAWIYTHTRVRAPGQDMDGKASAQAPAHVWTGGVTLKPHAQWEALIQARYGSPQFEDDLNERVLPSYLVWDAAISFRVRPNLTLSLMVENVFDREVVTGISASGLTSTGSPRWVGVKAGWEF